MPKPTTSPITETFGVFALHADGAVSLRLGGRIAELLAERLHLCSAHSLADDVDVMRALVDDYDRAERHAGQVPASLLPLGEFFTPEFVADEDEQEAREVAA